MNNRYISVHVRRTDLDKHLLGYRKELNHKRTSDEEFFKFRLDKLISCLNKKDLDEALILAKELVPEWMKSEN